MTSDLPTPRCSHGSTRQMGPLLGGMTLAMRLPGGGENAIPYRRDARSTTIRRCRIRRGPRPTTPRRLRHPVPNRHHGRAGYALGANASASGRPGLGAGRK